MGHRVRLFARFPLLGMTSQHACRPTLLSKLLCPGELIGNGTLVRHALSPGALQVDVTAQGALQMTALLVLEQRLLEVDVSLGDEHGHHPLVLDVGVPVEVRSDGPPGLRQLHFEIVQDQHPGQLSAIGLMSVEIEREVR